MRTLENELDNFFDDPKITDLRFDVFVAFVLLMLGAKNITGIYDDIIAEIKAVYDPFHLNISNLSVDFLLGKGKTELRENVISDFKEFASNNMGTVKTKYLKPHHDIYIQFYPYGMDDINKMNKTTAQIIIDRYASAAHTNVADFTPAFDAEAAAFKTRYSGAVDVQSTTKGTISTDRTGRDSGRTELNKVVFSGYNFVKSKCYADYDYMHAIFPLETLFRHTPHDIIHLNGTIAPLATVNIAQAIYDTNDWVLLHDTGICDLRIGLELTAETEVGTTNGKTVKKGKDKSFRIMSTGDPNNHFINITNLNLTEEARWKADIYTKD